VLFSERRGPTPIFVVIMLVVPAGLLIGVLTQTDTDGGSIGTILGVLAFLCFFALLYAYIAWVPGSSEFKSITVDHTGLTVGRRHLPVQELGRCAILSEAEAGSVANGRRYDGVRVGRKNVSYAFFASSGRAVFVVQERAGLPRPGWLVATRDPEGLLTALTELRAENRGRAR
jgi:hypothetical protein